MFGRTLYNFCINKIKPRDIFIPKHLIEQNFVRSQGPGGQNVNKVNSKAQIRFNLFEATWIQDEIKNKIKQKYSNLINNEGEIMIQCQEQRTQHQNLSIAFEKLQYIIWDCSIPVKERVMERVPEPVEFEKSRIDSKRKISEKKKTRQCIE